MKIVQAWSILTFLATLLKYFLSAIYPLQNVFWVFPLRRLILNVVLGRSSFSGAKASSTTQDFGNKIRL